MAAARRQLEEAGGCRLGNGMRAQKYMVLPQEDAAAFAVETAIVAELAPEGALQTDPAARRVAVAAWRLELADRLAAGTGLGPRRRREKGLGPHFPTSPATPNPAANRIGAS